jgi:hypothetical protein
MVGLCREVGDSNRLFRCVGRHKINSSANRESMASPGLVVPHHTEQTCSRSNIGSARHDVSAGSAHQTISDWAATLLITLLHQSVLTPGENHTGRRVSMARDRTQPITAAGETPRARRPLYSVPSSSGGISPRSDGWPGAAGMMHASDGALVPCTVTTVHSRAASVHHMNSPLPN